MVHLFTADAVWEMPPYPGWYRGPESIARLIASHCPAERPGDMRLVSTGANGQPAFAVYLRASEAMDQAFLVHVLDLDGPLVRHVAVFLDTTLCERLGLPRELPSCPAHPTG
jgi:RNA polymerase sigma-70 factor (ECF subfamily)